MMKSAAISVGTFGLVLALFLVALGGNEQAFDGRRHDGTNTLPASSTASSTGAPHASQGALYGRVTTDHQGVYEGRLRFGGDEEAFWGHYFNGFKAENPWIPYAPPEVRSQERSPLRIFGFEIPFGGGEMDFGRPFMARFGDIARIEASGRDLRVTLKSGTMFLLDRFAADDFADGLRVWDRTHGVVDLDEWRIRAIELLPTPPGTRSPQQLHATVRTAHAEFTGFVQWNRKECAASDELVGRTADGNVSLRFQTIRSIARRSRESALVTLLDGRTITLSGARDSAAADRGIYVDDSRYGRVLVFWDAFEHLEFNAGDSGPAYIDFPPGQPLNGSVTTRAGRRLAGRLVYDLDESETTDTLDAPSAGVDYTIPFSLIASIAPGRGDERGVQYVSVTLLNGEELHLQRAGDLGDGNAGLLIFAEGPEHAEYVPWHEVDRIEFAHLPGRNDIAAARRHLTMPD